MKELALIFSLVFVMGFYQRGAIANDKPSYGTCDEVKKSNQVQGGYDLNYRWPIDSQLHFLLEEGPSGALINGELYQGGEQFYSSASLPPQYTFTGKLLRSSVFNIKQKDAGAGEDREKENPLYRSYDSFFKLVDSDKPIKTTDPEKQIQFADNGGTHFSMTEELLIKLKPGEIPSPSVRRYRMDFSYVDNDLQIKKVAFDCRINSTKWDQKIDKRSKASSDFFKRKATESHILQGDPSAKKEIPVKDFPSRKNKKEKEEGSFN